MSSSQEPASIPGQSAQHCALPVSLPEDAAPDSEARLREMLQSAPVGIFRSTLQGRFLAANSAMLRIFGYDSEAEFLNAITDITRQIYVHPGQRQGLIDQALTSARHVRQEVEVYRKDGAILTVNLYLRAVRGCGGEVAWLEGFVEDNTEHKRTEQALRASESMLRTTFDSVPFELWVRDLEERCIMENHALKKHWGSLLGTRPEESAISPEERALWKSNNQRAYAGEVVDSEVTYYDGGVKKYFQNIIAPIRVGEQIQGILGVNIDISERKQLELQLRQAQKLEAIGTLAGGIAHDFNNILGAMICYAELASRAEPGDPQIREDLNEVLKACERARDLVRQILTFSSHIPQERQPASLGPIIKEALKLIRATIPASIEISTRLQPDLPQVLADPTQIHQVIVNLCANAAHAMRGKSGRLHVVLEKVSAASELRATLPPLPPGNYLRLIISDNGCGMDAQTQSRMFEPFFTTKSPGEGSGLGLSVVHGIVREHEGAIQVLSHPGQGTSVQIYFRPLSVACPEIEDRPGGLLPGNRESLLFVDDEAALCLTASRMLQRLNYQVTIKTDPRQALELFHSNPEQFDLVITDLSMPSLSGIDLAAAIRKLRPRLPILLVSGFSGPYTADRLRELGICDLLQKPVGLAELSQAIHGALHPPKA